MNAKRFGWVAVPVVAVPILVGATAPAYAAAQTRYVATTGNNSDNDCTDSTHPCQTIQYAVDEADAGDTVSVGPGSYAESVDIRKDLTLIGAGASSTTISGDGDDEGDPSIEVDGFDVETPPDVTISNLSASGNTDSDGIDVAGGSATLTNAAVNNNAYAGIANYAIEFFPPAAAARPRATAAALDLGQVVISSSTISGNQGQGIQADTGDTSVTNSTVNNNDFGGVEVETGSVEVTASTLDSNANGGIIVEGGGAAATVSYSTISHTSAVPDGDSQFAAGIEVAPGGSASVFDSTLADNANVGVLNDLGTTRISNSTVTGTTANAGSDFSGGLIDLNDDPTFRQPAVPGSHLTTRAVPADVIGALTATATIVAQNAVPDCSGTVTDGGYNLDSDGTCALTATGSTSHGNAALGALADNGGPTSTVLPAAGSNARNAIPVNSANCGTSVDQRGVPRPDSATGRCDIGAVEAAVSDPKISLKATAPHLHSGWYRGTVAVHSTCVLGSAPLITPCPGVVHLTSSGSHTVSKTIVALDGGHASASKKIKIDNKKPTITIKLIPIIHHNTTVLKLRGTCSDPLSGIAHCRIKTKKHHGIVHYTVTATDIAGNVRTKSGEYNPHA